MTSADEGIGDEMRSALEHVTRHTTTEPRVTVMSASQDALNVITSMLHTFDGIEPTVEAVESLQETWRLELAVYDPEATPAMSILVSQLLSLAVLLSTQVAVASNTLLQPVEPITPIQIIDPTISVLRTFYPD